MKNHNYNKYGNVLMVSNWYKFKMFLRERWKPILVGVSIPIVLLLMITILSSNVFGLEVALGNQTFSSFTGSFSGESDFTKITTPIDITLVSINVTSASTPSECIVRAGNSTTNYLMNGSFNGKKCTLYQNVSFSANSTFFIGIGNRGNNFAIDYTNAPQNRSFTSSSGVLFNWDWRFFVNVGANSIDDRNGTITYSAPNGQIAINSFEYYNTTNLILTNDSFIVFQGQTPVNDTKQYFYTSDDVTVMTNASFFGGRINTTIYLYNSTGLYATAFNSTINQTALFNTTFSNLPIETYRFNATATNGSRTNITSQVTFYIYNITVNGINSPSDNQNVSSQFLNITWNASSTTPNVTSISNYNVSLRNSDGSFNRSVNFTNGLFFYYNLYEQNLSIGFYKIRVSSIDANGNQAYQEQNFNLLTNTLLNISARTIAGTIINNFSINAYNSIYNYNITVNTTNGIAYINQIRGLINLTIDAEGYSTNFSKASIQVNTPNYTYRFTLYETNTFNITFYNQANPTVLLSGINISLDLISSLFAQNYTTNNGGLYLTLLIPETYTIRYYASSHTTRFYYFTLNNRSYNEIKLYLINNSVNYNYTVYVVNQVLNPVEGAIVKNLKYDLATNSYLVQEIGITDVTGKTTFTVTFNDEYYKQVVEYPSGTLKKTTTPDYIDTPSVIIPISLGDNNIAEEVISYAGISGALVFNNVSDNFRFDWSDTGLVASQYCLNVYRMTGLSQTLYNDSCSSGASAGTILLGVANGSGFVYYAVASYYEDSVQKYLTSLYYEYPTPVADEPLGNKYGLFIQLILTIGMTSLVVLNIGLAMILAPFSLIIGKILGWNVFSWFGLFALQVVGIILAILASMRK